MSLRRLYASPARECCRVIAICFLGFVVTCSAVAQTPEAATAPGEAEAIAWFKAASHPFADTTPTQLEASAFVEALGGARVYGIGEVTHGDHQDQAFKGAVIKALVRAGRVDTLALECNRLGATGLDRFARSGAGDLVALIRDKNFFRIWQDDEFADLILWLRAWNQTARRPVRIVGVDNQNANRDIAVALAFIKSRDVAAYRRLAAPLKDMLGHEAQDAKFYKWVVATPKPAFVRAEAGVDAVVATLEAHRAAWAGASGFDDAVYSARIARQGLRVFELEAGNPNVDMAALPPEYANRRDIAMAANLVALTEGHRAVLWAHDLHVLSSLDADTIAHGYVTMGSELRRSLGASYVSVGFSWSDGSFNAVPMSATTSGSFASHTDASPQVAPNDRAQDLGRVLAQAGIPRFWIDLRQAPHELATWGARPMYRGATGFVYDAAKWQTDPEDRMALLPSYDLLVYFHTITPSGMWPKLPD